jgi:hypothetical protein
LTFSEYIGNDGNCPGYDNIDDPERDNKVCLADQILAQFVPVLAGVCHSTKQTLNTLLTQVIKRNRLF